MATYQQGVPIKISDTFTVAGVETDPTTVTYRILGPDGTVTTYTNASPEVSHPSVGDFVLSLAPPTLPGVYQYDVDATGAVVASRAGSFTVIENVSSEAVIDWAVPGPCTPWASAQDVWNCCGQPVTTTGSGTSLVECPVDMSKYAFEGSQVLYELSGRQFSGLCVKTVRPCSTSCGCNWQVLSRGHIVYSGNGVGSWYCDDSPCGCNSLSRVKLSGYPVREITQVKIDGDIVAASGYRLDERRYLTRLNNTNWPGCQNLSLADTEDGTFSITYAYGMDPPILGRQAAAALGCELYRACTPGAGDCALPSGVTRITRQGVVVERIALANWGFRDGVWRTGMPLVDAFLSAYNPHRLMRRSVFWGASSSRRYARQVG